MLDHPPGRLLGDVEHSHLVGGKNSFGIAALCFQKAVRISNARIVDTTVARPPALASRASRPAEIDAGSVTSMVKGNGRGAKRAGQLIEPVTAAAAIPTVAPASIITLAKR